MDSECELGRWPLFTSSTDRLAHALEGVFPSRDGLHDVPQRIHAHLDDLAAWLDEVEPTASGY